MTGSPPTRPPWPKKAGSSLETAPSPIWVAVAAAPSRRARRGPAPHPRGRRRLPRRRADVSHPRGSVPPFHVGGGRRRRRDPLGARVELGTASSASAARTSAGSPRYTGPGRPASASTAAARTSAGSPRVRRRRRSISSSPASARAGRRPSSARGPPPRGASGRPRSGRGRRGRSRAPCPARRRGCALRPHLAVARREPPGAVEGRRGHPRCGRLVPRPQVPEPRLARDRAEERAELAGGHAEQVVHARRDERPRERGPTVDGRRRGRGPSRPSGAACQCGSGRPGTGERKHGIVVPMRLPR